MRKRSKGRGRGAWGVIGEFRGGHLFLCGFCLQTTPHCRLTLHPNPLPICTAMSKSILAQLWSQYLIAAQGQGLGWNSTTYISCWQITVATPRTTFLRLCMRAKWVEMNWWLVQVGSTSLTKLWTGPDSRTSRWPWVEDKAEKWKNRSWNKNDVKWVYGGTGLYFGLEWLALSSKAWRPMLQLYRGQQWL